MATKTMPQTLFGTDRERWGFFRVKGAESNTQIDGDLLMQDCVDTLKGHRKKKRLLEIKQQLMSNKDETSQEILLSELNQLVTTH